MPNTIKENWEKVDEVCPHCNQVTKQAKGITRQNMKRLVSFKGSKSSDWILTLIIILVLLMAWSYRNETAQCREWINPMFSSDCYSVCEQRCDLIKGTNSQTGGFDFININFTNTNLTNMNITTTNVTITKYS